MHKQTSAVLSAGAIASVRMGDVMMGSGVTKKMKSDTSKNQKNQKDSPKATDISVQLLSFPSQQLPRPQSQFVFITVSCTENSLQI